MATLSTYLFYDIQDIMADSFGDEVPGAAHMTTATAPVHASPLLDDPNDDFCRVCGFGVSILATAQHNTVCNSDQMTMQSVPAVSAYQACCFP